MKRRAIIVVALLLTGGSAIAGFRRQSAAFCIPTDSGNPILMTGYLGLVSTGSADGRFMCPLLDDSKFNRTTLTYVNIHVNDTNADAGRVVSAAACIQFWSVVGMACGNAAATSTQGPATLSPPVNQWTGFPADFAYVDVSVCPNCQVYGFFAGT